MTSKRSKSGPIPTTGFMAKLALWTRLVDEAVGATTPAAARKALQQAEALDHLPIDLGNEDDCDDEALEEAHAEWNAKITKRLQALSKVAKPPSRARTVEDELCSLRDLLNST